MARVITITLFSLSDALTLSTLPIWLLAAGVSIDNYMNVNCLTAHIAVVYIV